MRVQISPVTVYCISLSSVCKIVLSVSTCNILELEVGSITKIGCSITTCNNILIQDLFQHLPRNRALSKEAKTKAIHLLEVKANKKMIQQKLSFETGKVVLLKDLSMSLKKGKSRNDLDASVKIYLWEKTVKK